MVKVIPLFVYWDFQSQQSDFEPFQELSVSHQVLEDYVDKLNNHSTDIFLNPYFKTGTARPRDMWP